MNLGMTGTRHGVTAPQREFLSNLIAQASQLHHGACVGADAEAHDLAVASHVPIVVHPPSDKKLVYHAALRGGENVAVLDAKPYHDRNRDIVNSCDKLVALPDGPRRPHSGTWYTVRFACGEVDAHLLVRRVPVEVCYPDGEWELFVDETTAHV